MCNRALFLLILCAAALNAPPLFSSHFHFENGGLFDAGLWLIGVLGIAIVYLLARRRSGCSVR